MQGKITRIHPNGFFFIEVKQSPIGYVDQFFGLVSRIVSGAEHLVVGAVVSFDVSSKPKHGRLPEAANIIVHPMSDISGLTGAVSAKVGASC